MSFRLTSYYDDNQVPHEMENLYVFVFRDAARATLRIHHYALSSLALYGFCLNFKQIYFGVVLNAEREMTLIDLAVSLNCKFHFFHFFHIPSPSKMCMDISRSETHYTMCVRCAWLVENSPG